MSSRLELTRQGGTQGCAGGRIRAEGKMRGGGSKPREPGRENGKNNEEDDTRLQEAFEGSIGSGDWTSAPSSNWAEIVRICRTCWPTSAKMTNTQEIFTASSTSSSSSDSSSSSSFSSFSSSSSSPPQCCFLLSAASLCPSPSRINWSNSSSFLRWILCQYGIYRLCWLSWWWWWLGAKPVGNGRQWRQSWRPHLQMISLWKWRWEWLIILDDDKIMTL